VLLAVGISLPHARGPVDVAATEAPAPITAEATDDGQAILTWFGPDADGGDGGELPL